MGKKAKKVGAGKEKTQRKTEKALEKKARREDKKVSEEDDIDKILAEIKKAEAKKVEVHVEDNVDAPSPRCNCSLTLNPSKDTEFVLYGGEYYNGDKTYVYGDLYRYNAEKDEWKHVSSPNSPPPRSAHQAVAWKNFLFVFGGEFTSPNQERFHHYKDLWRLDLTTNSWEQLSLKGGPSPRSGHRMILYKHTIILFGGFYDTLREVKYYNDLYLLDLDTYKWQKVEPKPGALWPSPRSAFQLAQYQDEVFLYGGYFRGSDNADKGAVLADMWRLDPRSLEWEKVKKQGSPPGPRAGFSLCVHKKRAILFGGVVDVEDKEGENLKSVFMSEMFAFFMDNRRWYPLELRKPKVAKPRQGKAKQIAEPEEETQEDEQEPEEEREQEPEEEREQEHEEERKQEPEEEKEQEEDKGSLVDKVLDLRLEGKPKEAAVSENQLPAPCGRINASVVVGGNTLYLYGGIMEIGDQEVTLDDLWMLNLDKLDGWKCVAEATESEWIEVRDSEGSEDSDAESAPETSDTEESEAEDGRPSDEETVALTAAEEAAAKLRAVTEGGLSKKERKQELERIRSELSLADQDKTPQPGETLRVFFARTSLYWQQQAYEITLHTGKELRKDGFELAEARYKELEPLLVELEKLEAQQKADEEEAAKLAAAGKAKDKAKKGRR